MRYKPKITATLHIALDNLSVQMPVKSGSGYRVWANTVEELRNPTDWPENLALTTSQDGYADSEVKVSKVSAATRTSPK